MLGVQQQLSLMLQEAAKRVTEVEAGAANTAKQLADLEAVFAGLRGNWS